MLYWSSQKAELENGKQLHSVYIFVSNLNVSIPLGLHNMQLQTIDSKSQKWRNSIPHIVPSRLAEESVLVIVEKHQIRITKYSAHN